MATWSWRGFGQTLSPPFIAIMRRFFTPVEITITGAALGLAGAVLLAIGAWVPALVLLILSSMCDWLDGELARATDQMTPFGGFLDSVLDRISDCAPLAGLVAFFAKQGQPVGACLAGTALMVSILIPYTKARIEAIGYSVDVGILSRAPRQVLFLLGVVFGATTTVWALMAITAFGTITVVQRLRLAYAKLSSYEPV